MYNKKRFYHITSFLLAASLISCASASPKNDDRERLLLQAQVEALESQQASLRYKLSALEESILRLDERVKLMQRSSLAAGPEREVVRIEPGAGNGATLASHFAYDSSQNDEVYTEIVISEEKKRAYFGNKPKQGSSSAPTRRAYDNVVSDDRLPTKSSDSTATVTGSYSGETQDASLHYKEGIDLYRRGLYTQSRAKFEDFLNTKPEREYTDNALYWIGECYFALEDYEKALSYFERIVIHYSETNKVPDAMLKAAHCYQNLGKEDAANAMLRQLTSQHPLSEAARNAKMK
ncbi:MAG: tol-pal system protein YbgF [Bradymonadales bacterium]